LFFIAGRGIVSQQSFNARHCELQSLNLIGTQVTDAGRSALFAKADAEGSGGMSS
jgi:hypothetical protein